MTRRRDYSDRLTSPLPRFSDVLRLMWTGGLRTVRDDRERIPLLRTGLPAVTASDTTLTWVGHATYLIRTSGAAVLADPVWSQRIPAVPRRVTPPGVAFADLPQIDAVVISHNHYDHLDAATIRRLPRATPMLVPAGLGRWFHRRGFSEVIELDWWESVTVSGLRFDFVPAHHWSRRTMWDSCRSLWGGWVITGPDGRRLYHAGDTGYGHYFTEIGRRYPGIEVAMLPIGAYAPRWFMQAVHMDPAEAAQAFVDLGAVRMATMHWGTFTLTREPPAEPLQLVRKAWREAGRDPAELWDLAIGETRFVGTARTT